MTPRWQPAIGDCAYEVAHRDFVGDSHLEHYATLFQSLLASGPQ